LELLHAEHQLDILFVRFVYQPGIGEVSLSLGGFLGKNVAFEGMFPFDFPCSGDGEPFLGTGHCFHLWHAVNNYIINNQILIYFFLGLGESIMIILLPSSLGRASTLA